MNARRVNGVAGAAAVLLALYFAITGAGCNPQPACNAPTCGPGQEYVCGSTCETPVPLNDRCNDNPCGTTSGGVCVFGAYCGAAGLDQQLGERTCQPGESIGATCSPTADTCTAGTFCRDSTACGPPPIGSGTICVAAVGQDERCDSNLSPVQPRNDDTGTAAGGPSCAPCAVGSTCDVPTGPGASGAHTYCREPCSTATDPTNCPCGDSCATTPPNGIGLHGEPTVLSANYCYPCKAASQACSALSPCCDGSLCGTATGVRGTTCCWPPGKGVCTSDADCCTPGICNVEPGNVAFGTCGCPIGMTNCGGTCTDLNTDTNCGACGVTCLASGQLSNSETNGKCTGEGTDAKCTCKDPTLTFCESESGGVCADLSSDPNYCGSCTMPISVPAGYACNNGANCPASGTACSGPNECCKGLECRATGDPNGPIETCQPR
jgi:hypothetical protein